MRRPACLLAAGLCLAGCQTPPPENADWSEWRARVDRMDQAALQSEQEAALRQYDSDAGNRSRLRAGYALSRPEASLAQLEQSRALLEQIPADSELAPLRDLLDKEIALRMQLQRTQLRMRDLQLEVERLRSVKGEFEADMERLLTQIRSLQTQLAALKSIEEEMVESQQQTDEIQQ